VRVPACKPESRPAGAGRRAAPLPPPAPRPHLGGAGGRGAAARAAAPAAAAWPVRTHPTRRPPGAPLHPAAAPPGRRRCTSGAEHCPAPAPSATTNARHRSPRRSDMSDPHQTHPPRAQPPGQPPAAAPLPARGRGGAGAAHHRQTRRTPPIWARARPPLHSFGLTTWTNQRLAHKPKPSSSPTGPPLASLACQSPPEPWAPPRGGPAPRVACCGRRRRARRRALPGAAPITCPPFPSRHPSHPEPHERITAPRAPGRAPGGARAERRARRPGAPARGRGPTARPSTPSRRDATPLLVHQGRRGVPPRPPPGGPTCHPFCPTAHPSPRRPVRAPRRAETRVGAGGDFTAGRAPGWGPARREGLSLVKCRMLPVSLQYHAPLASPLAVPFAKL
jgi:hypothetical protein